MSIVSTNRLWSGRGGSDTLQRRRTYRETWEVITDTSDYNENSLYAEATALPRLGKRHGQDSRAIVVDVEANQSDDSPYIWHVDIKYDSHPDFGNDLNNSLDPKDIPENPLLRPAVWKVTYAKTSEAAVEWRAVDAGGNLANKFTAIRNSAELPFDPPLVVEKSRPVLRITKNLPRVEFSWLMRLEDAVNDRDWRTIPKWCARIDAVDAGNKFENGVPFIELSLDIALKEETWLARLLDAGYYSLDWRSTESGKKRTWTKIKDAYSHEATEPQPLDGNGKRLQPGADPVFLRGLPRNYHLENFSLLLGL